MRQSGSIGFALYASVLTMFVAVGCSSSSPGVKDGVDGAFIRAAATWDLNHDGNVTCDEWRQYAGQVFKEADLNRDGRLSPEEFQRLAKIDRLFETANFAYYDTDKKGYVTEADLTGKANPAFLELDKEKTCVIKSYQLRAAIFDEPKKSNPGIPNPGGGH